MAIEKIDTLESESSNRPRIALAAFGIAMITLLAYLPALNSGYIWDDDDYVTRNELLLDLDGLKRIWIPEQTPQYYPVVFTTFWVEYQLWELQPLGYHLNNILLHIASSLLLWRIMVRLKIPGGIVAAGLIGAIFALHPVQVETVAWITERKNVLSMVFYLSAVLMYLRFDDERASSDPGVNNQDIWGWYGMTLVLFIAALLSKSVTCSLPAALILMHLYRRQPLTKGRLATLTPMFIIGLIAAFNTARIEREHVGAEGLAFDLSILDRTLVASKALLFYPGKIVWPQPLIFIYPRWTIPPGNPLSYWPIGLVAILGISLIVLYRKGLRGPFIALSLFAGTVFPALGFFNVYPHLYSFVADHFQYHATIGLITLIVGGLFWGFPKKRSLVIALLMASLPMLAILTYRQGKNYKDETTLWLATVEKNPDSWMSWNNLGHLALDRGDHVAAEPYLRRCLELRPDHFNAWSNLSESLRRQDRNEEALEAIEEAFVQGERMIDEG
ncbi:MAG: tetratricopeptide repeat protein, partial [Planctomycetota bacterium]|nr:tetratricopeptide repeat protein [Planctomycetota bacterium]